MALGMNRGQEEKGGDGKSFSTWCLKLREPGACFCSACSRKTLDGSSGKTGLASH